MRCRDSSIFTGVLGLVVFVRVGFAAFCIAFGGMLGLGWGLLELVSLWQTIQNWAKAEQFRSASQWVVPCLYVLSGVVLPVDHSCLPWWVAWSIFAVTAYVRLSFGACYTAGPPTWFGLYEQGAYRWLRHPQSALGLAARAAVVCSWPSSFNLAMGALYLVCSLTELFVEERCLRERPEWRSYAERVRSRLVPGIW